MWHLLTEKEMREEKVTSPLKKNDSTGDGGEQGKLEVRKKLSLASLMKRRETDNTSSHQQAKTGTKADMVADGAVDGGDTANTATRGSNLPRGNPIPFLHLSRVLSPDLLHPLLLSLR